MNELDEILLENAIADYHALLASSRALAGESIAAFEAVKKEIDIFSLGHYRCDVLRPHFLTFELCKGFIPTKALSTIPLFHPLNKNGGFRLFNELAVMQEFSKLYEFSFMLFGRVGKTNLQVWEVSEVFPVVKEGLLIFTACEVKLEFDEQGLDPAKITPPNLPPSHVPIFLIEGRKDSPMRPADPDGCVG